MCPMSHDGRRGQIMNKRALIKGQRVRPTISPIGSRPLLPEEILYAAKVADYAARALR